MCRLHWLQAEIWEPCIVWIKAILVYLWCKLAICNVYHCKRLSCCRFMLSGLNQLRDQQCLFILKRVKNWFIFPTGKPSPHCSSEQGNIDSWMMQERIHESMHSLVYRYQRKIRAISTKTIIKLKPSIILCLLVVGPWQYSTVTTDWLCASSLCNLLFL